MNEGFICEAVAPLRVAAPKVRRPPGFLKELKCVTCGTTFFNKMSHAKYCGARCQPKKIRVFQCVRCGNDFESNQSKPSCCSNECLTAHKSAVAKENARIKGPPEHRKRICQHCGAQFISKKPGSAARKGLSREGIYCSRDCSGNAIRKYATKEEAKASERARDLARRPLKLAKPCVCGAMFIPRSNQLYCKPQCSPATIYKSVLSDKAALCKKCSTSFIPIEVGRSKFCSRTCTKEYHRDRSGTTHRKRARYHGVAYEYINPLKVMERDNYKCQVCGCKTPRRLRGSTDDRAPELDHRIPMALGGGHLWSNVQVACRKCNLAKGGTQIAGQTNFFEVMQPPRKHNNVKSECLREGLRDGVGQGAQGPP